MAFFGAGLFSLSRRRRQRARRKLLVVTGAILGLGVVAVAATAYSNLYVFGDSLSDTGNFYTATGNAPPASSPGYSNGQWILDLAGHLGLSASPSLQGGTNYAYGGALITGPSVVDGFSVPSVGDQIATYLQGTPGGNTADGDALYVVQAGPANLGGDGGAAAGTALAGLLGNLIQAGGRNFLVVTPPASPGNNPFFEALNLPPFGPGPGPGPGPDVVNPDPQPILVVVPELVPDPDGDDPDDDGPTPDLGPDLAVAACMALGTCPPTLPTLPQETVSLNQSEVPEPATLVLLGLGATLLLGRRRRLA